MKHVQIRRNSYDERMDARLVSITDGRQTTVLIGNDCDTEEDALQSLHEALRRHGARMVKEYREHARVMEEYLAIMDAEGL